MLRPCPAPTKPAWQPFSAALKASVWLPGFPGAFPGHCDDIGTHPLKPASHFPQLTLVSYPFSPRRSSSRWWRRPLEPAPDCCLCEDPAAPASARRHADTPPEPRFPRPSEGDRACAHLPRDSPALSVNSSTCLWAPSSRAAPLRPPDAHSRAALQRMMAIEPTPGSSFVFAKRM
uniref:Uncharacterized protein n=1 Tax=Myotis myotis TaxID=51298 RepID=A0A7J7WWL0_MYOMY|nr:hypothetical protein mMyoMyo1_011971 [Myotis myotis]